MANYTLLSSYNTVQVLSPTVVNDIVYCTIETSPSGVIASFPLDQAQFDDGVAGTKLTFYATVIEQIMTSYWISGGSGVQSIDDSGLLTDSVSFTVQYPNKTAAGSPITAQAIVPVRVLGGGGGNNETEAVDAALVITEQVYANLRKATEG